MQIDMEEEKQNSSGYYVHFLYIGKSIILINILLFAAFTLNFLRKYRKKTVKKQAEPEEEHHFYSKYGFIITQLNPYDLAPHFRKSMKRIKRRLWNFVIDAFYVAKYRTEWGQYTFWDFQSRQRRRRRKRPKTIGAEFSDQESFSETPNSSALAYRKSTVVHGHKHQFPPEEEIGPVAHNHSECERVIINVSGLKYETQIRTLNRFPNTLLGNPQKRMRFFNPDTNEYFFDRHRPSFDPIMYYYQSGGILRCPNGIHVDIFFEELDFFQIDDVAIEKLKETEGLAADEDKVVPVNLLKRKLWLLMEYPESSFQAKIVAILSIFVISISIYAFCMETTESFSYGGNEDPNSESRPEDYQDDVAEDDIYDPMFFLETVCICWFSFEFLMRAAACPNFFDFISDMMNLIDLIAILPYFLGILTYLLTAEATVDDKHGGIGPRITSDSKTGTLAIFRVIRLVRVFRIFKLSRHSKGLKVLGKTLKASLRELGMLVFFMIICIILFSSALFFAESSTPGSKFVSIPASFWYTVITMTTVGYGDDVPIGVLGKIVGGLCAVTGVLTISLPVPVIVSNFNSFYQRESYVGQLETGEGDSDDMSWRVDFLDQCPNRSGENFIITKSKKGKKTKARHYRFEKEYLKVRKSLMSESDSDEEFDALRFENRRNWRKASSSSNASNIQNCELYYN